MKILLVVVAIPVLIIPAFIVIVRATKDSEKEKNKLLEDRRMNIEGSEMAEFQLNKEIEERRARLAEKGQLHISTAA